MALCAQKRESIPFKGKVVAEAVSAVSAITEAKNKGLRACYDDIDFFLAKIAQRRRREHRTDGGGSVAAPVPR